MSSFNKQGYPIHFGSHRTHLSLFDVIYYCNYLPPGPVIDGPLPRAPVERTLEYFGVSMSKYQVVNTSIDGKEEAVKRALIPGHLLNANHWFDKYTSPSLPLYLNIYTLNYRHLHAPISNLITLSIVQYTEHAQLPPLHKCIYIYYACCCF
jgi:hypothetical protein